MDASQGLKPTASMLNSAAPANIFIFNVYEWHHFLPSLKICELPLTALPPYHSISNHFSPVTSTSDIHNLPSLHPSLPCSDLVPHHTSLMTTATSSQVTPLYKLVFPLLQVFFLKFDADHVILKLKNPLFASIEHLKHFII